MKNSPKHQIEEKDFLDIVNVFKDKLFRFAKHLLVSNEEAEDAVQEVVLKLWIQKEKIATIKNLESFAMTVTKNYCLDRLKSKQANNLKLIHSNFQDNRDDLEKRIEANDSVAWLHHFITQLPIQQQMIVQLRDVEQYEFDHIAEVMNMSHGAIRVALSRARSTLKKALLKTHEYGKRHPNIN